MIECIYKLIIPLLVIGIVGCSKEDDTSNVKSNSPSFSQLTMTEDGSFSITTEVRMSTRITPLADNRDCVSEAENQLRFKKNMDCLVYMIVKNNGKIDADIQMTDFGNKAEYPSKMIGCPKYDVAYLTDRIEVRDGVSTIYNKSGEIITTSYQSQIDEEFFQSVISTISKGINSKITGDNWEVVRQAMVNSGYEVVDRQTRRDEFIFALQRGDGGKTEITIDKELNVFSGNRNYDSEGKVTSANKTLFNDVESHKWEERIKAQVFVVPYTSPFVDCEMAIVKSAEYKSFEVQYQ